MNSIIIALLLVAIVSAAPHVEDVYKMKSPSYKEAPISELAELIDCVLYEKTCTPLGEAYRAVYPTVILEACSKCNEDQKKKGYVFFKRVQNEIPHKLDELKSQFDPEGKYFEAFFKVLEKSATSPSA